MQYSFYGFASRVGLNDSGIVQRTCASGSSKSDLEAMAKTNHNSNRFHGECRGSVSISTRSDISTRHLRPDRKRSLPLLNCFFISVPHNSNTLRRSPSVDATKVKGFGRLAQSLLFHLKQLVSTEEFCAVSALLQTFPILQYACPVSKRFTLATGLALSPALSKKQS